MQLDRSQGETDVLVFRESLHPVFGLSVMGGAVTVALATLLHLLTQRPDNSSPYIAGLLGCSFFIAFGFQMLLSKTVKLDRKRHQMTHSTTLLTVPIRTRSTELPINSTIAWKPRSSHDSTVYDICFASAIGDTLVFEEQTMHTAKNNTDKIAQFLGFEANHWDTNVLDAKAPQHLLRNVHFALGRRPWVVSQSDSMRLEFTQSFEGFLIYLAYFLALLGLCLLIAPWLGIPINGNVNASPERLLIGLLFLSVAMVLLFGKRGVTFDSSSRTVSLWRGIAITIWRRRLDLKQITKIAVEKSVIEVGGSLSRGNEVVLIGPNQRLVIFESLYENETISFAPMIAKHLNIPCESCFPTAVV